jgi:3-isopropylmalate dehydratase small subunit
LRFKRDARRRHPSRHGRVQRTRLRVRNIDTDQIIPAQYLNLVPTIPEEYEKLGAYALCGLPESLYPARYVKEGQLDSEYPIVVAGRNFGCGSSREHAPIAWGRPLAVVLGNFARIFFRNCIATGELRQIECPDRLCDAFRPATSPPSTSMPTPSATTGPARST